MKIRHGILAIVCLTVASGTLLKSSAFASSETETYQLHMEPPQVAQAANGDVVSISGMGVFQVNPKSVTASGTFTRSDSQGNILSSGTWTAGTDPLDRTQLLSFQPYGCGVVRGFPINPRACGGKLMLRILLTDTASQQQFYAVLWVFCIIGPNPPNSHDDPTGEGVNLDIIGVNNYNRIVSGGNVFIKTS